MGATPEGLIQRLEEETRVNAYIATEKLPKELEAQQAAVKSLQKVISQPALGQDDIKALKEKIRLVQDEVSRALGKNVALLFEKVYQTTLPF